jgi:Ni,Fe-hydrogenase I cytochrome b subunit
MTGERIAAATIRLQREVDMSTQVQGKLFPVYVWEAPVRIWHWVMMIAMFVLIPTGYLIGSPWSGPREEASYTYFFGNDWDPAICNSVDTYCQGFGHGSKFG